MNCPECQKDNPEDAKFCNQCGAKLPANCPKCGNFNPPGSKFCNECGHGLDKPTEKPASPADKRPSVDLAGERKTVTVLFSDMSGYTAMSEKLDPEEVKEITGLIFPKIAQVIARYEGFIEKYVGDAVMALFGVPQAHEDDPVRAILAAREIHNLVENLSPKWESKIGRRLSMHTGINTGLVVTGEIDVDKGTHGLSGDTINLAARLSSLAKDGVIITGPDTRVQADSYFNFEELEPAKVKGKAEPIRIYQVIAPRSRPGLFRNIHGLKAVHIGRQGELTRFEEACQALEKGRGSVFAVVGEAGIGKTRLVEEVKASLDPARFRWIEGQAYAFSQNTPYSLFRDLLGRLFELEELDDPEMTLGKIKSAVKGLIDHYERFVPHLAGIFGLTQPQAELGSPEHRRAKLYEALFEVLTGLARQASTVICLEDMHWADPSSISCLQFLVGRMSQPALLIYTHRPGFSPLTTHEISGLGAAYREVSVSELSPAETLKMLQSLLDSTELPRELCRFVQDKVGGNPFYIEEVINSLIESGIIKRENGIWNLRQHIRQLDIPSTVQGLITARLDRLEHESKRILQEASVIGRAFLYEILRRTTSLVNNLDQALGGLERQDLIQTRAVQPELEYAFKQALIQEVVYQGILKKERRAIHRRIAEILEENFSDRLEQFCEVLGFHYSSAETTEKAVHYLLLSGEKSLSRYSVDEAHNYYQQAYELLMADRETAKDDPVSLLELIYKWALVFYYRGDIKGLSALLSEHEELAVSLGDDSRLAMLYAWLGFTHWGEEKYQRSHEYLKKALALGEKSDDPRAISYACAWFSWVCPEMGRFEEGFAHAQRAISLRTMIPEDPYPYFKALGGIGYGCWYTGDRKRMEEIAEELLAFGLRQANIRCQVMGHYVRGLSLVVAGDFCSGIEVLQKAVEVAVDPLYTQFPAFMLGWCLLEDGKVDEAEKVVSSVIDFCKKFGFPELGMPAVSLMAGILAQRGQLAQSYKSIDQTMDHYRAVGRPVLEASAAHNKGRFFLEMLKAKGKVGLGTIARNVGFIVKNAPNADKRGIRHLLTSIEIFREYGALAFIGPSYLYLAQIHALKKREEQARECYQNAVKFFSKCVADTYLELAENELKSLS